MNWMMNNSAGKPDAMLTLGVITLGVVLFKFVMSEMSIGHVIFGQLDSGVIMALLGSTLGAYVARRGTDAFAPTKKDDNDAKQN